MQYFIVSGTLALRCIMECLVLIISQYCHAVHMVAVLFYGTTVCVLMSSLSLLTQVVPEKSH